jgi:mannose-6-phosphate isomerase
MANDGSMKLKPRLVEKPWGRTSIPAMFGDTSGRRIGEVWFEGPPDLPLLAKYIFTSERLSIQNHPSDEAAHERGLSSGKEECWLILDAELGATLGLGPKRKVSREELRRAALDGSIVDLIDWKRVTAGDFFYVPAGTIHAIGAGISLLEFQQNADVTYRLYDYGRPRELHLDEGLSVAFLSPYPDSRACHANGDAGVLTDGPPFVLLQSLGSDRQTDALVARRRWVLPIEGEASAGAFKAEAGECLLVEPGAQLAINGRALVGAEGRL